MPARASRLYRVSYLILRTLLLIFICGTVANSFAAFPDTPKPLAPTPPMGWNDWAHYQCGFTAQTIIDNARALVKTGLAARGYNTVTIDDCWMLKDRDAHGNLQPDPQRFPHGMKHVADAVHALGLKFGIYEDAGYLTCGGFAGSGEPNGGKDHFLQDARLFASWGVDYLKLDGCNLYVPKGSTKASVYRKAYASESAALKKVGRPIVFSESAPAYFQGTPDWYDVLGWVRDYGQLWREGTDVEIFRPKNPDAPRFQSVLWNYAYNLPLGRFQKPGNWNDPDFIIGGDAGMTLSETRSQMALWAMMSAPLNLSSDLDKLNPQAIAILGNRDIIAVDQDTLGRMATLIRRSPQIDILSKPLNDGGYAVAALNRSAAKIQVDLRPADLGFTAGAECRLDAQNLWTKAQSTVSRLQANIAPHDTAIWRIRPASSCGKPTRTGAITMIAPGKHHERIAGYTVCLAASGRVEACAGTSAEAWTITAAGALKSAGRCLTATGTNPAMKACSASDAAQHWNYTLAGNLVDANGGCLTAGGPNGIPRGLSIESCGHNQRNQIWSLPN